MKIIKFVLTTICLLLVSNCSTQRPKSVHNAETTQNANDLFIVDCLLPGQVRKLGQLASYITPRRPIKTTASDCEIRGGEYVAYDRASYATALKVWLPRAQAGEAEAQTYVGEIYEKGLGLQPDYNIAMQWYQKAANQGDSRAQINLGFLYERGLGVPQDLAAAMAWYKKSSGLEQAGLSYAATLETTAVNNDLRAEIKFLKTELNNSRNESKLLSGQLNNTQQQIQQGKQKLITLNQQLSTSKQKLQTTGLSSESAESVRLKQIISQKENEIKNYQQNIQGLENKFQKDFTSLKAQFEATEKRANQIAADLKNQSSASSQWQLQLIQTESKLANTEKQLLLLKQEAQDNIDLINAENDQLEAKLQELNTNQTQAQVPQQKSSQLQATIAQLEADKKALEIKVKKYQQNANTFVASTKPEIEIIDPPFVIVRGMPTVVLRSVVKQRDIIGKVRAPSGLLSLMINDRKSQIDDQGIFNSNIKLSGEQTSVSVVAIDKTGARSNLDFILSLSQAIDTSERTSQPPSQNELVKSWQSIKLGNYHALIIGNQNYKKVPALLTPINDARAVEEVLRDRYNFKTTLLVDGTRYQILSALNKLRAELSEEDNLLIYYAGHGELDEVNMRGHWLPIDADADNTANWISTVAITDILNMMSIKHVMVVSDSCYSGAMTRSSLARLESGISPEKKSEWLKVMLKARSRTVLTSGGLKPVMDGGGGNHSVFANAFIEALRYNNNLLEGQSLHRDMAARIVAIAARYGIEQVPEYAPIRHAGHESGEFFFAPVGG